MGRRKAKIKTFETFSYDKDDENLPPPPTEDDQAKVSNSVKRIQELKQLASAPRSRKRRSSALNQPTSTNLPAQQAGENFFQYKKRVKDHMNSVLHKTAKDRTRKKEKSRERKKMAEQKKREVRLHRQQGEQEEALSHDVVMFGEVVQAPPELPKLKKAVDAKNTYTGTLAASLLKSPKDTTVEDEKQLALAAYKRLKQKRRVSN
ncbi:hypothetical protein P9112_014544 [Eukaryota sp. TZLM1-RC]